MGSPVHALCESGKVVHLFDLYEALERGLVGILRGNHNRVHACPLDTISAREQLHHQLLWLSNVDMDGALANTRLTPGLVRNSPAGCRCHSVSLGLELNVAIH